MISVVVLFGTRPEAIKLSPVIRELMRRPDQFQVTVVNAGQHREILDQTVEVLAIRIDEALDLMRPGEGLPQLTGNLIGGIGSALARLKPDWVVVQGDTVSAFAGALAAFQNRIRVAHVEAGLRTNRKDHPFPEEINRRLIAPIADLNLAPTPGARDALLAEGIDPASIHVTGNTAIDALSFTAGQGDRTIDHDLAPIIEAGRRIVLVTAHRRENIGAGIRDICGAVARLAGDWPEVEFVVPVHHNPGIAATLRDRLAGISNVHLVTPLSYPDMVQVMARSTAILTDSGGIQEEAPTFSVPVLVLRETTERTESLVAGYSKLVGTDQARIVAEATAILDGSSEKISGPWQNPYGDGRAAERIAKIMADTH